MQTEPLFAIPTNPKKFESMGIQMGWIPRVTYAAGPPQSVCVRLARPGTCQIYGLWAQNDTGGWSMMSARARCLRPFGWKELLDHLEHGCDHSDRDVDGLRESGGVEGPDAGSETDGLEGGPLRSA